MGFTSFFAFLNSPGRPATPIRRASLDFGTPLHIFVAVAPRRPRRGRPSGDTRMHTGRSSILTRMPALLLGSVLLLPASVSAQENQPASSAEPSVGTPAPQGTAQGADQS